VARGPSEAELAIWDSHLGLKVAISSKLPDSYWQRCRTHFMRNILCKVRETAQSLIASMVPTIIEQSDAGAVDAGVL
jgi:putative transposase